MIMHHKQTRSQILLATVILLMVTLGIGAAVLLFNRSLTESTRQQSDLQKAYSLAKSGLEMANKCFQNDPVNCIIPETPFYVGGGNFIVKMTNNTELSGPSLLAVNIISKGAYAKARYELNYTAQKAIVSSLPPSSSLAWIYSSGSDNAHLHSAVAPRGSGYSGFAFFGATGDPFYYDFKVVKTDDQGNIEGGNCTSSTCWVRTYGGDYGEYDYYDNFKQSRNLAGSYDGYIIGGSTDSFASTNDPLILKINSAGALVYARSYAISPSRQDFHEEIMSIIQDDDDFDYVLAGFSQESIDAGADGLLLKVDSQTGNTVNFCNKYPHTRGSDEYLYCVRETADNGFIAGGKTDDVTNPTDFLLIKTDVNGAVTWGKTYNIGSAYDKLMSLEQTRNATGVADGYILAGEALRTGRSTDFILIRTDLGGNVTWARDYGGTGADYFYGVLRQIFNATNATVGYILGGLTYSFGKTDGDFLLIAVNATGNVSWAKAYGTDENEQFFSIDSPSNGGYILGGISSFLKPGMGIWDFFAMNVDPEGGINCSIVSDMAFQPNLTLDITSSVTNASFAVTAGSYSAIAANHTYNISIGSPVTNKTDVCNN